MTRPARRRLRSLALAGVIALLVAAGCGDDGGDAAAGHDGAGGGGGRITVAAASDLRVAFEELGGQFTDETGIDVTFSFGSSGQLREQIVNGAPFDLFASANVAFVDAVLDAGRGVPETKADYADGRIALYVPPGGALPASIDELADPAYRRIAVANPTHAPYGLAAVQALRAAGLHDEVADRLVYGENVSDALRIARSGNADVGIVALSLVLTEDGEHRLLPDDLHEPLRQALVVTAPPARVEAATAFASYVGSPAGREVMVRHGFALPGEPLPAG